METLNYGMLHYHCRPGGVRTVMENSAIALFKYGNFKELNISFIGDILSNKRYIGTFEINGKSVINIDINELNYGFKPYTSQKNITADAKKLRDKIIRAIPLKRCTFESPYYLHAHNINLGKSALICAAIYLLAKWAVDKPVVIIMQIHDFAENGRYNLLKNIQNCTGKFDNDFASKIMYPNEKSVIYATINQGDMQNLVEIGIDRERIFLLPNSIDIKEFHQKSLDSMTQDELKIIGIKKINFSNEIKNRIKIFADKKGFVFDKNKEIILAPLKSMRRKNIFESILLLKLMGKRYQLIVTLDAASGEDRKYSRKVKKFVKKHKIAAVIGIGDHIISPVPERVIDKEEIKFFNMDDIFEVSRAVITTSIVEGFGFVYHEGWLTDRFVFGRKIPYVTNAYEKDGMNFNHMYSKLNINPRWINLKRLKRKYFEKLNNLRQKQNYRPLSKDEFEIEFKQKKMKDGFIDFGDMDVVAQAIFLEKIDKYKKELVKINPHINPVLRVKKEVIEKNKKVSAKNYCLRAKAKRLAALFEKGKNLIRTPVKNKRTDNTGVIKQHIDLEDIRLLI